MPPKRMPLWFSVYMFTPLDTHLVSLAILGERLSYSNANQQKACLTFVSSPEQNLLQSGFEGHCLQDTCGKGVLGNIAAPDCLLFAGQDVQGEGFPYSK